MADQLLGGIVINEILVDPSGASNNFDTDGNGTADDVDEFVEFFNASNMEIDISGVQLWDAGVGNYFTFPAGSVLQPGAYALVVTGLSGGSLPVGGPNDLTFSAGRGSAAINNGGDNVVVLDPVGEDYIVATFNGSAVSEPTAGVGGFSGFPSGAMQIGTGDDFGTDADGLSVQRSPDGSDTFVTDTPTPVASSVCFANGTQFLGMDGALLVDDVQTGDLIQTVDHGLRPVKWIFSKTWTVSQVEQMPHLAAVVLQQGALGDGLPLRDLRVSQQHRILVSGPIAQRMFGADQVLIAAKHLLVLDGVYLDRPRKPLTYYHVMLEQHEIVLAEGLPAESLYLGAECLKSLSKGGLAEIELLLDQSIDDLMAAPPPKARPFAQGKRAKKLVTRHSKNAKPLVISQVAKASASA